MLCCLSLGSSILHTVVCGYPALCTVQAEYASRVSWVGNSLWEQVTKERTPHFWALVWLWGNKNLQEHGYQLCFPSLNAGY